MLPLWVVENNRRCWDLSWRNGGPKPEGRVMVEKVRQQCEIASEVDDCRLFYD